MGVGLGNSLLQVQEHVKRLEVPQKILSAIRPPLVLSLQSREGGLGNIFPLSSHEPRHEAVEKLRNNSCWPWGGSTGSVWRSVGTCHRECDSKPGCAWCTGMGVSHCRERGGTAGSRSARWRGCVCAEESLQVMGWMCGLGVDVV